MNIFRTDESSLRTLLSLYASFTASAIIPQRLSISVLGSSSPRYTILPLTTLVPGLMLNAMNWTFWYLYARTIVCITATARPLSSSESLWAWICTRYGILSGWISVFSHFFTESLSRSYFFSVWSVFLLSAV